MTYSNPIVPITDNPINLERAIQEIQLGLAAKLPWLNYSFGRAHTGQNAVPGGRPKTYPEVHVARGEYYNLEPNNHYGAHTFIQVVGPEKPVEYAPHMANVYTAELAVVCVYDLKQVAARMGWAVESRFGEIIKQQVREALGQLRCVEELTGIDETPTEVFRGYTYNQLEHQTFKFPQAGFKIAFTARYMEGTLACEGLAVEMAPALLIGGRQYLLS